jgi:hypothetical protein
MENPNWVFKTGALNHSATLPCDEIIGFLITGGEPLAFQRRRDWLWRHAARRQPRMQFCAAHRCAVTFERTNEISGLSSQLYLPVFLSVSIQP